MMAGWKENSYLQQNFPRDIFFQGIYWNPSSYPYNVQWGLMKYVNVDDSLLF